MKTRFIFALNAAQFAIICATPGTGFYQVNGMSDTANRVTLATTNADRATNAGASYFSPSGSYPSGTYVEMTVPCYIVADGSSAQDENTVSRFFHPSLLRSQARTHMCAHSHKTHAHTHTRTHAHTHTLTHSRPHKEHANTPYAR